MPSESSSRAFRATSAYRASSPSGRRDSWANMPRHRSACCRIRAASSAASLSGAEGNPGAVQDRMSHAAIAVRGMEYMRSTLEGGITAVRDWDNTQPNWALAVAAARAYNTGGALPAPFAAPASARVGAGADTAIQLPGGYLLPGVNVNQAALGSAVHACVRPERIVLHAHSEYPKTSAIPATVARAIYYGDHLRLMCDLGHGQEPATVKVALASSASTPHPQPGDAVLLEFPPVSTRIYAV